MELEKVIETIYERALETIDESLYELLKNTEDDEFYMDYKEAFGYIVEELQKFHNNEE